MCSGIGEGFIHSVEVIILFVLTEVRVFVRESHTIHINKMIETNEINDPREETTFHVVNASG